MTLTVFLLPPPFSLIAGIEAHGSPYLKMSFETTTKFLTSALLTGEHERMVSPSARIVMGRVVDSGTGAFDVMQPLQ
jgi:DNA-directed RNA polymerase I subunit RPA1